VLVGFALLAAACSTAADRPPLSAQAEKGREIAATAGCVACHGSNGEGGAGPKWFGLAGSTVTLDNGSTVVADTTYLHDAITDPEKQRVKGYAIHMPKNTLDQIEVNSVIAYIEELK
jgi:cytochrome c oxidase subunit 2